MAGPRRLPRARARAPALTPPPSGRAGPARPAATSAGSRLEAPSRGAASSLPARAPYRVTVLTLPRLLCSERGDSRESWAGSKSFLASACTYVRCGSAPDLTRTAARASAAAPRSFALLRLLPFGLPTLPFSTPF